MPELPEVETVKNSLKELVLNKKIISVDVYYDRIIQNVPIEYFKKSLINETFVDIKRLGKFLIFIFEKHILLSHLRMEGKYFLKGQEEKGKHEHVIFNLENNETLRYNDTRKFGVMYLVKPDKLFIDTPLKDLGLEPFSKDLTSSYLLSKFKIKKTPIKTILLDQSIITGIGNIYADEILFKSRIYPLKKASLLNESECLKIIDNTKEILEEAISLGGTTIRSYTSSLGVKGSYQTKLLVHTKTNCPLCNKKLEVIKIGGRSTYYCSNRQVQDE